MSLTPQMLSIIQKASAALIEKSDKDVHLELNLNSEEAKEITNLLAKLRVK